MTRPRTCLGSLLSSMLGLALPAVAEPPLSTEQIRDAFRAQSFVLSAAEVERVRPDIEQALNASCENRSRGGNSKVAFAAVQVAQRLEINAKLDPSVATRISRAIDSLPCNPPEHAVRRPDTSWEDYYNETIGLTRNDEFMRLTREKGFSPVKISWEDIGRYSDSVWGDRISDVGIWVRKEETDLRSAQLTLSVRRDQNFRDKVLMVPVENIKVHLASGSGTRELTLLERLRELDLTSERHDRNVIVSNQFAVVPVPKQQSGAFRENTPPRAAFNFSIFPYGSTNYVITDVIEGCSDAIVGPGTHQLLYYNADGKKSSFHRKPC